MSFIQRSVLGLFLLLFFFFSSSSLIIGRTPLETAQDDYAYQFSKYRETQTKFQISKGAYEKFKTATSKNEAFFATKDYLNQVNILYTSYLLLIIEKGNYIDWSEATDLRNKTITLINEEFTFIEGQKENISKTQTLEELPPISKISDDRIKKLTIFKLYKILSLYELTEAKSALKNLETMSTDIENYISNKPTYNASVIANWRSEIENIKKISRENIKAAEIILLDTTENTASEKQFKDISIRSNEAKSNIKRSKKLFEEVLRIL